MPMDRACPEFRNVARIPDAAPRSPGSTDPMIADEFGAANIPEPMPLTSSNSANNQYGKSTGMTISPTIDAATTSSPPAANSRSPNR